MVAPPQVATKIEGLCVKTVQETFRGAQRSNIVRTIG